MAGQLEFTLRAAPPPRVALEVSQLVRMVRETLEVQLDEYWVAGEVSNARVAPSKHLYFTLKDARSSISAVMFAAACRRLRFRIEDGMQIIVRGRVNLYEARGALQLYAEEAEPRGLGALQAAFEQLKQRLNREGLFDPALKRPLPMLPRTIGIVTALGGAALRDILRVMFDRFPNLHLIIRPSLVQGPAAASAIAAALDDLNRDGRADVIIVGRGGGSLEDLWPFNEEIVARAIRRSAIPVVSAVGHEIDYTIADFTADLRAPTPTAAAQMIVPHKADLQQRLDDFAAALGSSMEQALNAWRRHLTQLRARVRDPRGLIRQARQRLDDESAELEKAIAGRIAAIRRLIDDRQMRAGEAGLRAAIAARRMQVANLHAQLAAAVRVATGAARTRLGGAAARLNTVSPLRVLERGYAVVTRPGAGVITSAETVMIGDQVEIRLARGRLRAVTTEREV